MTDPQTSPRLRAALMIAAAVMMLVGLRWTDASAPDEPRYLEVSEELRAMHNGPSDLVLMHLNGEAYTQKPPLYYWLAAAIGAPFGRVTEWAGRMPSALAAIGTVWLTLVLGGRLFGGVAGALGAALLLSVYQFDHLGRRVQLDVLLTLLELVALMAFWWIDRGLARRKTLWLVAFHGAMGLAILTKGPVGLLVPLLGIVGFLAWERRLGDIRKVLPWWGWLLSVAPGVAWIAAASALAPAGFATEAVGTNLIGRFFEGTSHERPFYYFLYQFPLDFMPWTVLWPVVWIVGRKRVFDGDSPARDETRRAWRFLLAIVGMSLLFFSLSSGKRGLYMVPAFPAAALLCGDALRRWLAGRARPPRSLAIGAAVLAAVLALLGVEGLMAGLGNPLFTPEEQAAAFDTPWLLAFGSATVGFVAAGVVAWVVCLRNRAPALAYPIVGIATALAVELAVFLALYPALEPIRSPRAIAQAAGALTPEGESIGLLSDRALIGALNYYGGRKVAPLRSPESVEAFVAGGGKAIVVKRRKLDRIEVVTPVEVVSSARTGRREIVVVAPTSGAGDATPPAVSAPPASP